MVTPAGLAANGPASCAAPAAAAGAAGAGLPLVAALGLAVAFVLVLAATPLARRIALRAGAVDRPGVRSVHREPVPYLGGLAIFVGILGGLGTLAALHPAALGGNGSALLGIALGGALIVVFGAADDLGRFWSGRLPWLADSEGRGLRPAAKLVVEIGAALILCACGVRIPDIHRPFSANPCAYIVFGPPAQYALSVLWVVAITNAVNLIDGLDGLAAGVSAISAGTLLIVALLNPSMGAAALLSAVVLGACAGFLPFNFHPARIFMGDAGALLLGFVLSAVSLIEPLKSPTLVTLAVPILVLGVPILDTGLAVLRRWRRGQLVGAADRAHVHHRLLDLGLSHRDAVLSLYAASGWLGVSALAALNVRDHLYALVQILGRGMGWSLLGGLGVSAAVALLLTPLAGRLAHRLGAVAGGGAGAPARGPLPYLGGLALLPAAAAGLAAARLLAGPQPDLALRRLLGLAAGALIVLASGIVDDAGPRWAARAPWLADARGRRLRPELRVGAQVAAAAVLCAAGVRIPDVHMPLSRDPGQYLVFGAAAQYALTMLWVVAITNAVGFIDGLDGLASGVAAISAAALLGAALLTPGLGAAALVAAAVCGACVGFLPHNFHPARVLTGRGGALVLGFALSSVSVIGPLKGATAITLAVPVLAIGVPVFDILLAILRRSGPAPGHLHDGLLRAGLGQRRSVLLLYGLSAALGMGALAVQGFSPQVGAVVVLFVAGSAWLGAHLAIRVPAPGASPSGPAPSLR